MSKNASPRIQIEETLTRVHRAAAPMPRWVMITLMILLLLVLVFVVLHFVGNGMGSMHISMIEAGGHAL